MRVSLTPALVLLSLGLACAKPAMEHELSSDERGDDEDRADRQNPLDDNSPVARFPVAEPPVDNCPASTIREVRYGSTVPQQLELRPAIASLRCVETSNPKLAADIECANNYNRASWTYAFASAGLTPLENTGGFGEVDHQGPLELGAVYPSRENPKRRLVFIGMEGGNSGCDGTNLNTPPSPGVKLARNQNGKTVVVIPTPDIEGRSYPTCRCNSGCGAQQQTMPRFMELEPKTKLAGQVELRYPAIAITTHTVESESCCCAP